MDALINAIPQYKKAIKRTGVQQEHLTQPWENLKVLTTKAMHKSFVKHISPFLNRLFHSESFMYYND